MSKLHVLRDLGVNCIWFTPIYTSPQVDNGYDVADYRDIDPAYGTIEDFKELLDMAHSMGIRVIMDMVLNYRILMQIIFSGRRYLEQKAY